MSEIIHVGDGATETVAGSLFLMTGSALDDETILTCIKEAGTPNNGRKVSFSDAIASLVAEKLLALGIVKGGGKLVLPTAGIITRNHRAGVSNHRESDDGTLVYLRRRISEAVHSTEVMRTGLQLGDRGVHFAAGIESGHMKRIMRGRDRLQYAAQMARMGYTTALEAAEAHKGGKLSGAIRAAVPVLIDNLGPIISVMIAINPRVAEITMELGSSDLPEL